MVAKSDNGGRLRGRRNAGDPKPLGAAAQGLRAGHLRTAWVIVVAVVLVSLVAWAVSRDRGNAADPSQPVDVARARRQGLAFYEQGRFAAAVAAYESALSVADDPDTRTNLGNALKKLGRFDEAEAQYRRVLARDHRNATAWYDLGNLLRDQRHDRRGAVEAWRNATEFAPQMAEPHFSLGAALTDLNDYEAAIAELEAAVQLAPENAPWREEAVKALALARLRAAERKGLLPPPRK